jgi:DNA repair protein RadC
MARREQVLLSAGPNNARVHASVVRVRFTVDRGVGGPHVGHLLSDASLASNLSRQLIPDDGREHFGVFLLGATNSLIRWHEVAIGTTGASLVEPSCVFGPALRLLGVRSLIMVHSHPSGDTDPSREDIELTQRLIKVGDLVDIKVLDHVIIGFPDRYTSLLQDGRAFFGRNGNRHA